MGDLLLLLRFPQWWHRRVGGGYTMFPANMKPHVIAAMLNMETPVNVTEQGQTQVCAKVIVDGRVILHHIVAKWAVALRHQLLLSIQCYHPGLRGSDHGKRQWEPLYKRWRCRSGGGHSTLNWNTPSRAQPYPSRMGGKSKQDELYVVCAALPTSSRAVCLFRLSTRQCNTSGLSEWNHEETNVKNYTVDLTHFSRFFFSSRPMMYSIHNVTRACLFTEGEGYHMRMRTDQLPTKMDDTQDSYSPTLCTSHWGWAVIQW